MTRMSALRSLMHGAAKGCIEPIAALGRQVIIGIAVWKCMDTIDPGYVGTRV